MRRSDGAGVRLPPGPPVLAVGAQQHNALCLGIGTQVWETPVLGPLDDPQASAQHHRVVAEALARWHTDAGPPICLVHDLHPDFGSTQHAQACAQGLGLPTLAVQHHHAHLAAVWGEHAQGEGQPDLVGLALDGLGLGTDGQAWGGELLQLKGHQVQRLGHLLPLALPGGDAATRAPWRMGLSVLHRLGRRSEAQRLAERIGQAEAADWLWHWLDHPSDRLRQTTALGRYFDAAAALLGLCDNGEVPTHDLAAQRLEVLAATHGTTPPLAGGWQIRSDGQLDLLPLMDWLATECPSPAVGAACFHATLGQALCDWLINALEQSRCPSVALAGGCLHNQLLRHEWQQRWPRSAPRPLWPQHRPPGDAAIAWGQAVVARLYLGHN